MLTYLTFHGIGTSLAQIPEAERDYWLAPSLYQQVVDMALSRPDTERVRFTFDDGNASDLEFGAPVLRDQGRTATFFVLADRIGEPAYLDSDALRELCAMGMTIGLHGAGHVDWRHADDAALARELRVGRERIADAAGQSIDTASVPFGRYDRRVLNWLRREGFAQVLTSDGGRARPGAWIRPRTSVRSNMAALDLEQAVRGTMPPLRALRRNLAMMAKRLA